MPGADSIEKAVQPPPEFFGIQTDSINLDLFRDLGDQLQPLDSIIAMALRFSPALRFEEAAVRSAKFNERYMRYIWMNGLSGFYNYAWGNQFAIVQSNVSSGNSATNSIGEGYRTGVNVQLSVSELFARPAKNKMAHAEYDMARNKLNEAVLIVKRQVIADYFNMIASQKILNVRIQDAESARLSAEIGTVEMKRGKIPPSELARLKNVQTLAEAALELAKRDFMTSFYQLETLLGVKLATLKKK